MNGEKIGASGVGEFSTGSDFAVFQALWKKNRSMNFF
jgi:hypothetical protein